MDSSALTVVVEPANPPTAGRSWNWHVSFDLGHCSTEAFAAQDLSDISFVDCDGYFEIPVSKSDLVDYVLHEIVPTGEV
jgi:hypothetical protein